MKRLTIRARLTLVYGSLFVFSGIVLLGVTYVLVAAQLPRKISGLVPEALLRGIPLRGSATSAQLREAIVRYEQNVRENTLNSLLTQGGIALVLVAMVAIGMLHTFDTSGTVRDALGFASST